MELKKIVVALGMAAGAIASAAHAAPVTSLPGGTVIPMAPLNLFTAGPIVQAPGIVWSSGSSESVFGYIDRYGFVSNGEWSGLPAMVGTNDGTTTMEYAFSTPQFGVGGTLNYAPGFGDDPTISVFDSTHALIESSVLSFSTTGAGEFHGFLESSASIAYFSLAGSYIGLRDLTIQTPNPIPEPETYAMMLAGLGLLGFAARRRKQKSMAS